MFHGGGAEAVLMGATAEATRRALASPAVLSRLSFAIEKAAANRGVSISAASAARNLVKAVAEGEEPRYEEPAK